MRSLLILTLVALATACDEDCPHHDEPAIFVKEKQEVRKWQDYTFKFIVASDKPFCKCKINLKKIVKGDHHPELVDTDFDVSLRTLRDEEIKEWKETMDHHHHYTHVVLGTVKTGRLDCKDRAPYLVKYGDHHHDDDEEQNDGDDHHHHHGFFFLDVQGCRRPDEE